MSKKLITLDARQNIKYISIDINRPIAPKKAQISLWLIVSDNKKAQIGPELTIIE